MSVELQVSKPASGKTHNCIQKVRDALSSQPLSDVWVVVPDRLQAVSFRNLVARAGGELGAHIGTFGDLYRHILEHTGNYYPIASAPLLHYVIQEAVDTLSKSGELVYYAPLRTLPGFFLALRDAFAELKRSLVFPEQFQEYARSGSRAHQELANLYYLYQSRLRELGWADPEGLSWLAVETLEENSTVAASVQLLVVDGFDSFTGAQRKALQLLAHQVNELFVTFPGEANSRRPAYRRFTRTLEKLLGELSPQVTSLLNAPKLPQDILYIENILFETREEVAKKPEALFLYETRSPADEAREALRWIKARVVRDGVPLNECAIFTPNPDVYNSFLRISAIEFGIPVYFTRGAALTGTSAIAALLNLLALPAQNFKTRLLFNALRSPYFKFGLEPGKVDALEDIARKARIVEGHEQWQETWKRLIPSQAQELLELDEERILPGLPRGDLAAALRDSLKSFFDLLAIPSAEQSQTSWVSWLEDLLERLNFYENLWTERDELACEVFRDTLRALILSESVVGERQMDYAGFLSNLEGTLRGVGAPEPRLKGDPALLIGSMLEARGVRFKAVALLGLSEGLFPEVERPDPFLDEPLRQALGLEPRLNREQAGLFYQAVTRADWYLLITRPYLSYDGEKWEASPFWKDILKRFDPSAVKVVRPDDPLPLDEAASSHELLFWAVRRRAIPAGFGEFMARWQSLQHARDVLQARRARQPQGEHEGFVRGISPELSKQYAPGKVWSASRLEAYGNCPQQFYVKVVLGLEPRAVPELGMDVSQRGTLLHKILEETYCNAADPCDVNSLLAILSSVAQGVFATAPDDYGFRPSTLWTFEQAQLVATLQKTIEALVEKSEGWTPLAYEKKFGIDELPALKVDLGPETVYLRGVIDRVDQNSAGEIRIVDYKTGSSHLTDKDLKNGSRLQLPLYALAARDALVLGNVTEGLYWKIQGAEAGSLKLSRFKGEDGEGIEAAIQVAVEHLVRILGGIRAAEFPPKPPRDGCPPYCAAAQWCWRYEPGWGGRQ